MALIMMKHPDGTGHTGISDAVENFLKRCRLKNLSPRSLEFYDETLKHFISHIPQIKFVDEVTQEVLDEFISGSIQPCISFSV